MPASRPSRTIHTLWARISAKIDAAFLATYGVSLRRGPQR